MNIAITYSKKDPAGINIIEQLKQISFTSQIPIIELKKQTIYSEDLNEKNYPKLRNLDFLIFASKHASKQKTPSLSLHAPGNWRQADFGGKPGKVCPTSSQILKYLFQSLNKLSTSLNNKYKITLECTHHGPLTEIPCCFIELGSSEKQWKEIEPAKVLAKTILSLQNFKPNPNYIPAIAIGGPHYCPNFNKMQLNSKYALSHIIPEYVFPLTEAMLKQAVEKTIEPVELAILDWKGCGKSADREKIIELLEKAGLEYKRTSEIEK